MSEISSKHIVITGAAGSMGSAMMTYFLNHGWIVTGIDKHGTFTSVPFSEKAANYILEADLTDENEFTNKIAPYFSNKPLISVWVNNAGLIHSELLLNLLQRGNPLHNLSNFETVWKSNTLTTFLSGRWIANYFIEKRIKGNIINISSISAQGNLGQTAYAAAKAAVEAMTKVWAKELGRLGIRVNAIAPGFIESESTTKALSEQKMLLLKKETPLGRLGKPEEVAQLVSLISENGFINGQIIGVDGGLTIHS